MTSARAADRNEILLDIAVRLATFDEGFAHILEQRATDQNVEGTAPPRVDDRPRGGRWPQECTDPYRGIEDDAQA